MRVLHAAVFLFLFASTAWSRTVHIPRAGTVGPPEPERNQHASSWVWDAALHLDVQRMFGKLARPIEARWIRRYDIGLGLGIALGGIPESIVEYYDKTYPKSSEGDTRGDEARSHNVRRGRTAFWGGAVVDWMFWGRDGKAPYVAAELGMGYGEVYRRDEATGEKADAKKAKMKYVEPGAYGALITWDTIDFGGHLAYRYVNVATDEVASSRDMSGLAIGLCARKRM